MAVGIQRFEKLASWFASCKLLWVSLCVIVLFLLPQILPNYNIRHVNQTSGPALVIMASSDISKQFMALQQRQEYTGGRHPVRNESDINLNKFVDDNKDKTAIPNIFTDSESSSHLIFSNWDKMANISGILYNRVPKCGSTTTQYLFRGLKKLNHFNFSYSSLYSERHISKEKQLDFIDRINNLPKPFVFDRHIHFVDFASYGYPFPMYINLIRDPVNRFGSAYHYKRQQDRDRYTEAAFNRSINTCIEGDYSECSEKKSFKIVPFFCGQEDFCTYPNRKALNKAKRNVKKYFAVVGIIEDYKSYFDVLACVFPQYFKGVEDIYNSGEKLRVTKHKEPILYKNRNIMERRLKLEYEFYEFIKERFMYQKSKLKDFCQNIII